MGTMRLPGAVREAMTAHARFEEPNEACGLLAADVEGTVRMVYCLTNTAASPVAFALDPTEHYRALRHAESLGWHLAGVFHSHPNGPALPSDTDVAQALEPEWVYVIVAPRGEIRGFRITQGEVTEEPLEAAA